MKKALLILLATTFLYSCTTTSEKPTPFLEEQEMTNMLVDLSLAEGSRVYAASKRDSSSKKLTVEQNYALVFAKYDLTKAEFDTINKWYVSHSKIYKNVYKGVVDSLNVVKKEITKNKEKDKKIRQEANKKRKEKIAIEKKEREAARLKKIADGKKQKELDRLKQIENEKNK
ncbi:MAG: DUF4296 domain-containing protein [Ichthyobacteriaceae bacterium]|nr:DUF4296 domain-containing protein [Ichthyobacteriaceae bacterium]